MSKRDNKKLETDIDFDTLLNSYDDMLQIQKTSQIDFHVKNIIASQEANQEYILPDELDMDVIVKIFELVEKEKDKKRFELEKQLIEEQDREYEEALKRDIERIEENKKKNEILEDKQLTREELRQARLKYYCGK
jgi:hypothetical protein